MTSRERYNKLTLSTYGFFKRFPNQEVVRLHIKAKCWGGKCPHCGEEKRVQTYEYKRENHSAKVYVDSMAHTNGIGSV